MDIRTHVEPLYSLNDLGHQIAHADEVYELALELAKYVNYDNLELVKLSVYLHDVMVHKGRAQHHKRAKKFALSKAADIIFDGISKEDRKLVAAACNEHRASYRGEFTSILSEIVSSADRGRPAEFNRMWDRLMCTHASSPTQEYREIVINHIKAKYGREGYARYPKLYLNYFKSDIDKRFEIIDNM